ncbi:urease accessory protein UreF [Ruegeria sp. HKCCD6228]|uniref:urease accessory protein UreF n=1 Tax=unclassified Ruegeria TaxID=2625375 RepID=UPI0014889F0B|nr:MULTISPECIES: urease accessory UreF family protein [unclassified Ruegeria]NOD97216.1 urease accessory protein UreF [Ruegeria sp. HKCCD6228]
MATPTEADILTLTQWLSPAYPVGGFAYSHGLETAIDEGAVASSQDAEAWISDVQEHGSGWNDALFVVSAYNAQDNDELISVDTKARAICASSERKMETELLGQAFGTVTGDVWDLDIQQLSYPVSVGYAAHLQGLPILLTTKLYLQAFASNLVACATRLVPLGQTDAQKLIRNLTPLCARIAEQAQMAGLDELSSTAFLTDIASMRHEIQYSRIFRT